ncbi:MAG: hypothetical protein M3P40_12845 [Actinomycetota bacterium]|nr:hypothetical protein [Actinomycetota bacterium]
MSDRARLFERVAELSKPARSGEARVDLARQIEDLLCDGYATALKTDSSIRRLDRRRRELVALGEEEARRDELSDLERHRAELVERAAAIRRELDELRKRFVQMGGARATHR